MTTAAVMIADALEEIGVLGEGQTPTTDMISRGLRMLNRILDTNAHLRQFDFTSPRLSVALTGQASLDIGPTGDIATDRPLNIESAIATLGNIDYPVDVIEADQWDSIAYKSSTGSVPECVYYDGAYPDGNLYLYPVSSGATLKLRVTTSVKSFANAYVDLNMPEGYEDALMLALAVRSCPSYSRPVNPETKLAAMNAMRIIKRTNRTIKKLKLPEAMTSNGASGLAAIYRG